MKFGVQPWLFLAIGVIVAAATAFFWRWPGPVLSVDIEQSRINAAVPAPAAGEVVQTFRPGHNNLFETTVRLTAVEPVTDPAARSTITVIGPDGQTLAVNTVRDVDHDGPLDLSLSFPPQKNSRGQPYQITFEGRDGSRLALHGYTLNTLADSTLVLPSQFSAEENHPHVLYLRSRYSLGWIDATAAAAAQAGRWWLILLTAVLLIPLPGAVLTSWRPPRWPPLVVWGVSWAAGVALWPLLWAALSAVGGRWSTPLLWLTLVVGWTGVGWRWGPIKPKRLIEPVSFVLFLLIVLAVRLVAVRDAATLPWVDAGRHALITTLMRSSGEFLTTYRPLLAVDLAPYHYGLHTLTAGVGILLPAAPLTDLLPAVMQLLSTVICLAVYSGSWLLTGRRAIGWGAAFLVGIPFFFPGYYTTWGRLTQLAGLIVLAVLIGLLWRLRTPGRRPLLELLFVGLTAGLFYIHVRVFLLFLPLWGLVGLLALCRWRRPAVRQRLLGRWGRTAAGVIVLCAPRLWALTSRFSGLVVVQPAAPDSAANAFPVGYVTTGWERQFWIATAIVLSLLLAAWLWRRQPDRMIHGPLLLALWIAILGVLVGGSYLHPRWPIWLPQVTLNSAYISLFVPQSMILAAGGWWLVQQSKRGPAWIHALVLVGLGGSVTAAALFGLHTQADILNRETLLVQESDLIAITWLDDHVPADARIAHSSWQWLPRVWSGQDGGAWLLPLTGRWVTTPPIDHIYSGDGLARTIAFNSAAADIDDWSSPAANDLLDRFAITHLFVGVRSGPLDPAALARNPAWEIAFQHGGAFVFSRGQPPDLNH